MADVAILYPLKRFSGLFNRVLKGILPRNVLRKQSLIQILRKSWDQHEQNLKKKYENKEIFTDKLKK